MNESLLELSHGVELADVRDFLELKGWTSVSARNERLEIFRPESSDMPPIELVLPRSSSAADLVNRVVDVAITLSRLFRTPPEMIIRQIREIGEDVLCTRLVGEVTEEDSIPLDLAAKVVDSLKKLLLYAGSGEISPLPFFSRPLGKAIANGKRCRFGHTFRGSFGFTVESPLARSTPMTLLNPDLSVSYERRVIERVYRGIWTAHQASRERDLAPVLENYETGLNANMCDALIEMTDPNARANFEFSVTWSPKVPETSGLAELPKLSLNGEALDILKTASDRLRRMEESRKLTIEGRVVLLKSDSQPWEDEPDDPHTIVLAWRDEERKVTRTRVVLSPEYYMRACDAHLNGRTVSISGIFERRGKYSRLINPTNFRSGSQSDLFDPQNESDA